MKEALAKQEQGEQLAKLGWQEIDCPICGGGARAFPKQEQGEPVAEYIGNNPDELDLSKRIGLIHRLKFIPLRSKLYTTPQQRTWVGLTEQEQGAIMEDLNAHGTNLYHFAKAIEAKLKEKNT